MIRIVQFTQKSHDKLFKIWIAETSKIVYTIYRKRFFLYEKQTH